MKIGAILAPRLGLFLAESHGWPWFAEAERNNPGLQPCQPTSGFSPSDPCCGRHSMVKVGGCSMLRPVKGR
jgi:hypothetical protein